jgi:hypothetical protein
MPRRPTLEVVVLVVSLLADAAVLYFADEPAARLSLGLLLLAPIVWAAARLGVVELVTQSPSDKVHKRRFVALRGQVGQLLDEIRRLNWMAVDAERGFRSREAALQEMDRIEGRLKALIQEIRITAGQMSAEQEGAAVTEGGEAKAD